MTLFESQWWELSNSDLFLQFLATVTLHVLIFVCVRICVCTLICLPQVVQVWDLLHAEPAELTAADSTGHVVTTAIVHLDDVSSTAWTWLDVISWEAKKKERESDLIMYLVSLTSYTTAINTLIQVTSFQL